MGVYEQQLAQGKLLAMMPDHKRKVKKALVDIRQMLAVCNSPYVSLSWGKQSICLMHLVYQVAQTVPGVFWRWGETILIADFDATINKFCSKWPIEYVEILSDDATVDSKLKELANAYNVTSGSDGVFIGLVRDESKVRRYTTAKADTHNIYRLKNGFYRSTPLRYWSDMDIAAYAASNNIPMLSTYRRFGFDVRTTSRIKLNGQSHSQKGVDYLTSEQQSQLRRLKNGT